MKRSTTLIFYLLLPAAAMIAQPHPDLPKAAYQFYPNLSQMYGFAVGKSDNKFLIFGGKIKSDVPELYPADFPNLEIILVDMDQKRATAFSSGNLEGILGEHMAASGLAYFQKGNTLYLMGGYGYSETHRQYMTFPYLTAIEMKETIAALLNGENPVAHFYQICDERIAIFDGILDYNGDEFFLINGRYAYKLQPFDNEPYYFEESREGEAHTFRIDGKLKQLQLKDFKTWYDAGELRNYYGPLLPAKVDEAVEKTIQKKINQ